MCLAVATVATLVAPPLNSSVTERLSSRSSRSWQSWLLISKIILRHTSISASSLLSGRNVHGLHRMLPPGESRWVSRRDTETDGRTSDRYITLSARRGWRTKWHWPMSAIGGYVAYSWRLFGFHAVSQSTNGSYIVQRISE